MIVIYNPKSRSATGSWARPATSSWPTGDPETPVGIVTGAMRPNQEVRIVPLQALGAAPVGMQTTLFVGSRSSSRYLDFMFTPRGYAGKYAIGADARTGCS